VVSTHQAFSAMAATSQAQSAGRPSAASHRSQTSLAATCAAASDSSPSSMPTTAPPGRPATRTDSPLDSGTTRTARATATHDAVVGASARKTQAATTCKAASSATPTVAGRAHGVAAKDMAAL
jgi:hypothetical protein